jgi:hypothetical protein
VEELPLLLPLLLLLLGVGLAVAAGLGLGLAVTGGVRLGSGPNNVSFPAPFKTPLLGVGAGLGESVRITGLGESVTFPVAKNVGSFCATATLKSTVKVQKTRLRRIAYHGRKKRFVLRRRKLTISAARSTWLGSWTAGKATATPHDSCNT